MFDLLKSPLGQRLGIAPVCSLLGSVAWLAGTSAPAPAQVPQIAYTTPIGVYVTKVPGQAQGAAPSKTWLGVQLLPTVHFAGSVASVQGSLMTFPGTVPGGDASRSYYVQVITGEGRGFLADIIEFQSNAVVCGKDLSGWAGASTQIRIYPHPHLADLFGASNKFGLGPGESAETADNIILHGPGNNAGRVFYFHAGRSRWEEAGVAADASLAPVRFPYGFAVVRRTSGSLRFSFKGLVSDAPVLLPVQPGNNVFSLPVNLKATVSSRLSASAPFSILKGSNAAQADVMTFEDPFSRIIRGPFYLQASPESSGWRTIGQNNASAASTRLDMMGTLTLRRTGPASYVRAEGSLVPPEIPVPPLPADPEPGETPLTTEYPFTLPPPNPALTVEFQTSTDLAHWSPYPYTGNSAGKVVFTLPPGSSRAYYRIAVTANF